MRVTHTSVAVAFTLALAAGACNNDRNFPDPSDRTKQALSDANIKEVNVDWDQEARVAHLKGTATSWLQRDAAERAAYDASGITLVDNQIIVDPPDTDVCEIF